MSQFIINTKCKKYRIKNTLNVQRLYLGVITCRVDRAITQTSAINGSDDTVRGIQQETGIERESMNRRTTRRRYSYGEADRHPVCDVLGKRDSTHKKSNKF